jgi:predicted ATPase/class 3 adenylate cyclase
VADVPSVTYLFSDIEGSTRLWEADPEGASRAIAWHDAISRAAVLGQHGTVVKMTGDGMHAAFDDPGTAAAAAIALQLALATPPDGLPALRVRCGLHLGLDQRRDNDYFGPAVNRAARIMGAAHGGQILLSQAVAERIAGALPDGAALRELGQVRLKDLSSPERVFQLVHRALRADFPALRSLASTPNNLPQQLNSFVGREREMAEVCALLAKCRLVTLVAMGGVGKSRLSIQVGAEVLENYPDGVWLVELAPIGNAADVPQAVAAVLGVKEEAGGGVIDALKRFVRDRRLLLVVDNCEHVVGGVAEVAKQLLQSGPALTILASSRDPLQIAGEFVYQLPTLAVPGADERRPQQLEQHASVRLFLDRVIAAQPAFRLTDAIAAAVAEICRRLDGIPLALELAAARARSLPVDVIATRLDQRFRLLTSGDRTVLPRQRTLRALIDWSFELLGERERAVFRRLSVFAGGWTVDSAESVVPDDRVLREDVLDVVAGLVEKSLAAIEIDTGRYRMLDTVRHYALERLAESGEGADVRLRHCEYFVGLAEQARAAPRGDERVHAHERLDAERDNLLAALDIETSGRADALALRLTDALRYYLISRGLPSIALRTAQNLLLRASLQGASVDRCKTLFAAGQVAYFMGRHRDAVLHLTESLALARSLADDVWVAAALQPLGMAWIGVGDHAAAAACLDEALARAEGLSNQSELLGALNARAMLHRLLGEAAAAERLYQRALALSRELHDAESTSLLLLNLAIVAIARGEREAARRTLLEAIAAAQAAHSRVALQAALDVAAGCAASESDWNATARFYAASEAEARQTGLQRDPADEAFLAPLIARARDAGSAAYDAAAALGAELPLERAVAEATQWLRDSAPAAATAC